MMELDAQPGDGEHPLARHTANFTALSPLSFLARAAEVYPDKTALIHGERRWSWQQVAARCRALAATLEARGVGAGDVVSVIAPNIPALFELHFAVPLAGATLNTINTRLDAHTIAYILEHGNCRVLFVDRDCTTVVREALDGCRVSPLLIDIDDPESSGDAIAALDYETCMETGNERHPWQLPADEWQSIALNYTSGTTGKPKGVLYHHRGAYLNALSNLTGWQMGPDPVYLWTLPMFHCNGWCFPWSLAAHAATSVCCRSVSAATIYDGINRLGVTHFCGAPVVLNMVINAEPATAVSLPHPVHVMTAAAPPPPSVLSRMEALGFRITHVYGLTETYGPAVICAWHREWDALPSATRAARKARQGVRYQVLEAVDVLDPESLQPVPADGETIGEVMFRGNIVMRGYLHDPEANALAFRGGWFHSGDLAVKDPDGYLRILDRAKDIIISGGENISSIEIEDVLYDHPDVLEAAVAARPDSHWGETPCAFVTLAHGSELTQEALIAWCRDRMASFKCPRTIVFADLPKTSTGKIRKFELRERARALGTSDAPGSTS